jgi:hypothetical protein
MQFDIKTKHCLKGNTKKLKGLRHQPWKRMVKKKVIKKKSQMCSMDDLELQETSDDAETHKSTPSFGFFSFSRSFLRKPSLD